MSNGIFCDESRFLRHVPSKFVKDPSSCVEDRARETHLFKAGLDEVGLVDEAHLEVGQTLLLEAVGLLPSQLLGVTNVGQERRQVVNLHLLFTHLLLHDLPLLQHRAVDV